MSNGSTDKRDFGNAREVDTNPGGTEPAELQGICFGDMVPNLPCVLIRLHVRITVDGNVVEGGRDPMMIDYFTLKQLHDNIPRLLAHMNVQGADVDRLPLPTLPLPAWNEGPRFESAIDTRALCVGFGFYEDTLPEKGAAIAYIELYDAMRGGEVTGGRYIMSHRALRLLFEALPKVLRKMEQKGHHRLPRLH